MKIYFARHGESQANILHEISNRGLRHPLTQNGRKQAELLAERLRDRSIVRIYSSPVLRAIETSVIVANHLCVEYEVTEALREYDMGDYEGQCDEQAWQVWQEVFDNWTGRQRWEHSAPGGENFYAIERRFVPFIQGLIEQYGGADTNVLCIAHGGLYWMMLPRILVNVDTNFIHEHGAFTYASFLVAEPRAEGLACVEWNGERIPG